MLKDVIEVRALGTIIRFTGVFAPLRDEKEFAVLYAAVSGEPIEPVGSGRS